MNVYEMYEANAYKFGFYVIRDTWERFIARIEYIEGVTEGEPIPGRSPYFNNPTVYATMYKVKDNTSDIASKLCNIDSFFDDVELSCPGNYSYKLCVRKFM